MAAPPDVYQRRRATLGKALRRPLVLCAGHAPSRTYPANTHYFRAGSTYLYFGGPPVQHAALIIEPGSDGAAGCTLLCVPATLDDAVWMGPTPNDDVLTAAAGLPPDAVAPPDAVTKLLGGRPAARIAPQAIETVRWAQENGLEPAGDAELRPIIDLRLYKDEHELAAMRRAAEISIAGFQAAFAAIRPGRREADVMAAFMQVLLAHECAPSFSPIVTVRGEVLHSESYRNPLAAGRLLLMDAGAEEPGGYASDITRTVPVSGQWTDMQRRLYEVVERANREAVAACTPGTRFRDVHDVSARVICEGLADVGLLKGKPEALLERRAHTLFYTHGVGHLIGLDAHDMEDFGDLAGYAPGRTRRSGFGDKFLRLDRDLQPGMCVTIEPGVYFVPAIWRSAEMVRPLSDVVDRERVDALVAEPFGGIRVEHTLCVRDADGPEVLTAALPTAADAVAAPVGGG